ncbi:DUF4262 domain-containing protein [Amycolatopsis anabasis]|uniref:DUF4262 domain-containing protein n=1 Tax=Amycolatopsis anabasis TaxID=1840409 RepID=UPI00131AB331|nr:DUF4262 domain-containing protein [Amycolatopsis anabasis]
MCWQCDHPGSTREDYLAHLLDVVARCGWAVEGIERDRSHPPWAYTIGLTEHDRPELVVTGMPLAPAYILLNSVATHLLHARAPEPGERIPWHDGPLIEIVEIAEPSAHLNSAVALYGAAIRALQLVHADDRGGWPWDRGYRGCRGGQPVLGLRARDPSPGPP